MNYSLSITWNSSLNFYLTHTAIVLALCQTAFQVLHTYFLPSWETAGSNSYKHAGVWDLTARFESGLLHFPAVRPWASYVTPLYLDFLI